MKEEKYIALKKTDFKIILFLILFPLIIKAILAFSPTKDVYFEIKYYTNNHETIEYIKPIETKTFIISGKIGKMIIEFDQKKGVRVASSTCPCQVCVNTGWSKNDALVCVPNSVLIKPINSNKDDVIDAVTR